ncbi:hypothetical protein [Parvibacter caecicola]|uniref:hypothetical protein n=1 Tax=Parvibacter caecicola TaxID=747645 RepID=UPI00272F70A7|nr:hypothetical protein [Parvibacter caecicola]
MAQSAIDPQPAHAAQAGKWQQSGGRWWYSYDNGGYAKAEWAAISGSWYLFDDAGWMKTGWHKAGNKWYYLKPSGAMATGWQQVGKNWYYLNQSGVMATSWKELGGKWYHLDSSGAMATGWKKIGGAWYYFKSSGAMATGWQQVGKNWYYLKPSGAMATGWQQVNGSWYHLTSSGAMDSSKWVGNYYVNASGRMVTNQWVGNYWVGPDGAWVPGANGSSSSNQATSYRVVFKVSKSSYLKPISSGGGFIMYSSNTLSTQIVKSGGSATAPTVELNTGYYLKGWDRSFSNVRSNMTITAIIGDEYDDWRARWIKENLNASMSEYDKVNKLVEMISNYPYSTASSSGRGLYFTGSGDCYAGNLMLADFCKDLGIRCVFQDAMTMQRWYNVSFGGIGNHHNDVVWMDGKQYLVDATPGYMLIQPYTPQTWDAQAHALIQGTSSLSDGGQTRAPSMANSYYTECVYVTCGLTKNQFTFSSDSGADAIYFEAFCSEIVSVTSSNQSAMLDGNGSGNYIANEKYDEKLDIPPYGRACLVFKQKGTTTITVKVRGVYGVDKGKESTFTHTVTYQ